MIRWTTIREVAFERVCSFSTEDGAFYSSVGVTQNQTRTSSYFTFSNTYEELNTAFVIETKTTTDSGETIFQPTGQIQTSTTSVASGGRLVTSSNTAQIPEWSTSVNSNSQTVFDTTTAQGSSFFAQTATPNNRTATAITTIGTQIANGLHVLDTIVRAEANEVLWVLIEEPTYSAPLTENAISTTITTISQSVSTASVFSTQITNISLVSSTNSTVATTFTPASAATYSVMVNAFLFAAPGSSSAVTFERPERDEPQEQTYVVSNQPQVLHYGNTETRTAISQSMTTATYSDHAGQETWEETAFVYGTTSVIDAINNVVFVTSCQGNTSVNVPILGAQARIAPNPSMTVFAVYGVQIGTELGFEYVGSGFLPLSDLETAEYGLAGPITANNGRLPNVVTILPITTQDDRGLTQNGASVTFSSSTQTGSQSEPTTISATVGIAGETWSQPDRIRANLLGGNLAESETAQIAIERGCYKNQSGQTSWFDGTYESWTGTKDTTYWYPISYLEPAIVNGVLNFPVYPAIRNETTYPSFVNMP